MSRRILFPRSKCKSSLFTFGQLKIRFLFFFFFLLFLKIIHPTLLSFRQPALFAFYFCPISI